MLLVLNLASLALAALVAARRCPLATIFAGAFALAIAFDTAWPFFIPACWRFT